MANNAAFEDLELDISDMMSDPEAFSSRVMKIANNLREICKADHSVNGMMSAMKGSRIPIDPEFSKCFEDLYEEADREYPVEMLPAIIERAEQLVKDLKTMFKDKVIYATSAQNNGMQDKRVAFAQYQALRDKYNLWAEFQENVLGSDTKFQLIPAMTGNFGPPGGSLKYYVFEHAKHGQFRNPRPVIDKINHDTNKNLPRQMTLMDLIENHVDDLEAGGWTVKEFS